MKLHKRTLAAAVVAAVLIGGCIGLKNDQASASTAAKPQAAESSEPQVATSDKSQSSASKDSKKVSVGKGKVAPDPAASKAGKPPAKTAKGQDAAVEGFVEAMAWALTSEVSAASPQQVGEALGEKLNFADATLIEGFDRSGGASVAIEEGAYRVLGYSGSAENPDQVMVEVSVPMTIDGRRNRMIAGGVMVLTSEGWKVASMRPREVKPDETVVDQADIVEELTAGDQGLGWQRFLSGGEG
ncbi:hypothetical protein ACFWQC_27820 [Nocardioides sp. NPDC058538]|uniref:hypothetical protein n=1 Tax=Nocardioides sp. NPDC058538 TaxID=3346542 RepID=UPI003659BAB4